MGEMKALCDKYYEEVEVRLPFILKTEVTITVAPSGRQVQVYGDFEAQVHDLFDDPKAIQEKYPQVAEAVAVKNALYKEIQDRMKVVAKELGTNVPFLWQKVDPKRIYGGLWHT